jgi:putative membrane protein
MNAPWSGIINVLTYFAVSLPLLGIGIACFMLATPYKEYSLIRNGGETEDCQKTAAAQAAAYDLGGKVLGLGIVLASAIFHSVNIQDLAIWGLFGALAQVAVFYLFELITPFKVTAEIPRGNVSVGIFSAFLSTATGLIIAALIS